MDKQILALFIPILAITFVGLAALSRTAIGQAIARRIGGGAPDDAGRLEELEGEVTRLRDELAEVHERLDFTERLLARGEREESESG